MQLPTLSGTSTDTMDLLVVGTYRMKGSTLILAIKNAIEIGYRAFDTAAVYRNEKEIGIALAHVFEHTTVKREELFIQTKIGPANQGYDETISCVNDSLKSLGIDYLDCVLIHWPGKSGVNPTSPANASARHDSYAALQYLKSRGLVRIIGVSNYTLAHLNEFSHSNEEWDGPSVNQVEVHPLWNGWISDMHNQLIKNSGMKIQAYTLFGEGNFLNGEIVLESVVRIAQQIRVAMGEDITVDIYKGCACVLMKWAVMKGLLIAVKASSYARLKENFGYDGVLLSEADVKSIDDEASIHGLKKFCWNPDSVV